MSSSASSSSSNGDEVKSQPTQQDVVIAACTVATVVVRYSGSNDLTSGRDQTVQTIVDIVNGMNNPYNPNYYVNYRYFGQGIFHFWSKIKKMRICERGAEDYSLKCVAGPVGSFLRQKSAHQLKLSPYAAYGPQQWNQGDTLDSKMIEVRDLLLHSVSATVPAGFRLLSDVFPFLTVEQALKQIENASDF